MLGREVSRYGGRGTPGIYAPLCMVAILLPGIPSTYTPWGTLRMPTVCRPAAAVLGEWSLTALAQGVTKLFVSDGRFTVLTPVSLLGITNTRFTVGENVPHPGDIPYGWGPCWQDCSPPVHPIVAESGEQRGAHSHRFEQNVLIRRAIPYGPAPPDNHPFHWPATEKTVISWSGIMSG